MSEQRAPIVGTRIQKILTADEAAKQAELDKEVARIAELKKNLRVNLYERSAVSSALNVPLPSHVHGEWVRNETLRIIEKQALGFEVDREFAPKQALHAGNADGSATVGDLIFMTCPQENYQLIQQLQAEEYTRRHGKPGQVNQTQVEERGFISEQNTLSGSHIGTSNASAAVPVAVKT
jgi:hypothetical protein